MRRIKIAFTVRLLALMGAFCAVGRVWADTETVNGITWTYTVNNGEASVGGGSSTSIAVPKTTGGAITIPSTLGGCPVTSIGSYAFYKCSGLTSVTIGSGVTSIGYRAFEGCTGLKSVAIPEGVTSIGGRVFYGCRSIANVTIPQGVTTIADCAFYCCSGLTKVTLPDTIISFGQESFFCCSGLTDVTIPNSTQIISDRAFTGCGFTSVSIPDSVTSIGRAPWFGCEGLKSFSVDDGNMSYKSVNGLLLSKDGNSLIQGVNGDVTIPDGVAILEYEAFGGCRNLASVTIPSSVRSIEARAFTQCHSLTSVIIPCSVTNIDEYAFAFSARLANVTIPNSITSIKAWAFSGCGLTSITIPDPVTTIEDCAFSSCSMLTSVTLPDSVTSIGYAAFSSCSSLTNMVACNGVTNIGARAFYNCSSLKVLKLKYGVVSRDKTFEAVSGVVLTLADDTTAFDTGFLALANELKPKVSILEVPASVTNVQLAAVNQLVNLTKIIFKGASRSAISESDLQYLISSGLEVAFEEDGAGGGTVEPETPKLPTQRMVRIVSSGIRADNPNIFDVTYVVSNMTETANVRILAFKDGVRSFANVLRPTTFVDGTEVNVGSDVLANIEHTVSWNVADDWNIDLGRVSVEVLTLEDCAIPLKLMTIPRTSSHAAVRFSYNALTSAKVLDALLWHYASPNSGLTLTDGVLAFGGNDLADGTEVTEEGVRYVLDAHGYRLLEGDELEYVKRLSRLSLDPSGVRQYGIVTLED